MIQKICIISDAYSPQVNGVVRHVMDTISFLENSGKEILLVSPQDFKKKLCISRADRVEWVLPSQYKILERYLDTFSPDAIHIMTEGSVGLMAKKYCKKNKLRYTTSYHTRWPEYFEKRYHIPLKISEFFLKQFHASSQKILTPSPYLAQEIKKKKYTLSGDVKVLPNGVNTDVFSKKNGKNYFDEQNLNPKNLPVLLFVGRVCPEKNIEAFLSLSLLGKKFLKVVVGDGPSRKALENTFPDTLFLGEKFGSELSRIYSSADIFVFPSKTDTFGIVLLESLACGTPIAGYVMQGTEYIAGILGEKSGVVPEKMGIFMDDSLENSLKKGLESVSKSDVKFIEISKQIQKNFSIESVGKKFLENLVTV